VVSTKRFSENLKAKMLGELARAMRQAYITDVVAIISKAKVPIIKFVTNAGV
jgi:non-canonical poly(A) RNA polymerase PAPD5/7